ncbi:MAG: TIGR03560 family F420-dependent LLM class oxidoreductase [Actinobacteria bacterium]|nr:TIGR03560 family F420-dependent LLM class oxidoreductase [Actinomycetota bacterium]
MSADLRVRVLMEPRNGASYEEILALAAATEQAGFDAFFRSDHLLGGNPDNPEYRPTDCWTTLGGLARDTSRVRLGALMTASTFRAPGLLATIVASVDNMSDGRAELGIGAAWYTREHEAFGLPFPPLGERFDRLEEQLAIITGLWRATPDQGFSFDGRHYQVDNNRTPPRVTQQPHPPIIIGGGGPKRTPALAARYAAEFNAAYGGDPAERFQRFGRACEAIGRDPASARLSGVLPVAIGSTPADIERRGRIAGSPMLRDVMVVGPPALLADRIADLAKAGADTVYLHIFDIDDLDHIALIGAEVLPQLAGL